MSCCGVVPEPRTRRTAASPKASVTAAASAVASGQQGGGSLRQLMTSENRPRAEARGRLGWMAVRARVLPGPDPWSRCRTCGDGQTADEGERGEGQEHVLDADAGDDEADRPGAEEEPAAARTSWSGAQGAPAGVRVELGEGKLEAEGDGLRDGVGDRGHDDDLGRGARAEPVTRPGARWRGGRRGVPAFAADLVDGQRADEGGEHTDGGGDPAVEQAGVQRELESRCR